MVWGAWCWGQYGNEVREAGVDQLTDVFYAFVKKFGFILVSHGETSKILKQGVTGSVINFSEEAGD